ncbi:MAG: hypothetical protein QM305_09810, partial [Bacteroidota bacterium]|nr:hypothetical protein [Bacteroidota bacterium]
SGPSRLEGGLFKGHPFFLLSPSALFSLFPVPRPGGFSLPVPSAASSLPAQRFPLFVPHVFFQVPKCFRNFALVKIERRSPNG